MPQKGYTICGMNRIHYISNQPRPARIVYLSRAWCHWNSNQVAEAGGWNDAQKKMMDRTRVFGYHQFGANHFDEWEIKREDNGTASVECNCYYKS